MLKYCQIFISYEEWRQKKCSYYSIFVELIFWINNVGYYTIFLVVSTVGVDILITHSVLLEMHRTNKFCLLLLALIFVYANAVKKP